MNSVLHPRLESGSMQQKLDLRQVLDASRILIEVVDKLQQQGVNIDFDVSRFEGLVPDPAIDLRGFSVGDGEIAMENVLERAIAQTLAKPGTKLIIRIEGD